ncbi:SGNH/GDSL hydrolase family protein [Aquiflexum sp. TKW24L]|uniref:SGNH/GDSL hydrolase family protein n=1 Tax=Aquiflexum sp. TKW24L TaxID=2942212 RepID=UPI0020C0411F|nr:SGNH/GDSL hydrolase family protein [Aquiflexum sp. TKW24L]MCL6260772.1 SGNH/GDSL hydrolase family protein [Aquiflexum sp. TKW24L]
MAGKIKIWFGNILILVVSLTIAFLIGEGVIRLLYKDQITLFPRYTTDAHYGEFSIRRMIPNLKFKHRSVDGVFHFKTNNKGFRSDEDIEYAKKANELRVLVIGDSHSFGAEVNQEECYAAVTQYLLRENGLDVTVINAGFAGSGTAEHLVFLENEGYKYDPDFVVLGFYANDFADNVRSSIFKINNDSLILNNKTYLPGVKIQNVIYKFGLVRFLGQNSYLYAYLYNTIWAMVKESFSKKGKEIAVEYAVAMDDDYSDYEQKLVRKLLERMYNFTSELAIPLIILDIPRVGIQSSVPDNLLDTFNNNSNYFIYSQDLLKEYSQMKLAHVPNGNRHISAESHQLLGNLVVEYILANR